MAKRKSCPTCYKRAPGVANFCPRCGESIERVRPRRSPPMRKDLEALAVTPEKRWGAGVWIIVLAVLLLSFLMASF